MFFLSGGLDHGGFDSTSDSGLAHLRNGHQQKRQRRQTGPSKTKMSFAFHLHNIICSFPRRRRTTAIIAVLLAITQLAIIRIRLVDDRRSIKKYRANSCGRREYTKKQELFIYFVSLALALSYICPRDVLHDCSLLLPLLE